MQWKKKKAYSRCSALNGVYYEEKGEKYTESCCLFIIFRVYYTGFYTCFYAWTPMYSATYLSLSKLGLGAWFRETSIFLCKLKLHSRITFYGVDCSIKHIALLLALFINEEVQICLRLSFLVSISHLPAINENQSQKPWVAALQVLEVK